jgi:exodeoxyribonuclease VII large subunit
MREASAGALRQLTDARRSTPVLLERVRGQAIGALATAKANTTSNMNAVIERARRSSTRSAEQAKAALTTTIDGARTSIDRARTTAEALVREVTGQGADKTLARGFALVRDEAGTTVTSATHAAAAAAMQVQFADGTVGVRIDPQNHLPGEPE